MPRQKRKQKDVLSIATSAKRRRVDREEEPSSTPNRNAVNGEADGEFWSIRDIIEENKCCYKVDWEDHPRTGQKFSPSWVCVCSDYVVIDHVVILYSRAYP